MSKIFFDNGDNIKPRGFYLLKRDADNFILGMKANKIFPGAIKNNDESLRLFDSNCGLLDEVLANKGKNKNWPAGAASLDYRTAERSSDLSWHTYFGNASLLSGKKIFGTPRAENSSPAQPPAKTAPQNTSSATASSTPSKKPAGNGETGVIISEIMAGIKGNPNYEFIELYNPATENIDLTGWTIKKKSSTGSESTLVASARLNGKIIPSHKYLLLANSGGYTGGVSADIVWPSSYAFAQVNNAVIIYNKSGEAVGNIFWKEIPEGKSYARIPLDGSNFTVGDPTPQNSSR